MQQEYILENDIFEAILVLKESIDNRKYWCTFNYTFTFDKIKEIINWVNGVYINYSGESLKESSRRINENTFIGDVNLYITYYNAILYLTKLRIKVEHRQKYGRFENE
jgi:hypothetical protein